MRLDTSEMSAQELLQVLASAAADCFPRDRDRFAAACPMSPGTLVGSYFRHEDDSGEILEGMVVGNPHATPVTSFYLVEFFGQNGALGCQQIVDLERMVAERWSFFDSEAWLASAAAVPKKEEA